MNGNDATSGFWKKWTGMMQHQDFKRNKPEWCNSKNWDDAISGFERIKLVCCNFRILKESNRDDAISGFERIKLGWCNFRILKERNRDEATPRTGMMQFQDLKELNWYAATSGFWKKGTGMMQLQDFEKNKLGWCNFRILKERNQDNATSGFWKEQTGLM